MERVLVEERHGLALLAGVDGEETLVGVPVVQVASLDPTDDGFKGCDYPQYLCDER